MASSTTARPLTVGEELRATGHPWQRPITGVFSLQAIYMYLQRNKIPSGANWWPSKWHFLRFLGYVGAAQVLGFGTAMLVFRDASAHRMWVQHIRDAQHSVGYDSPESGLTDTVPKKPTKVWDFETSPRPVVKMADWK